MTGATDSANPQAIGSYFGPIGAHRAVLKHPAFAAAGREIGAIASGRQRQEGSATTARKLHFENRRTEGLPPMLGGAVLCSLNPLTIGNGPPQPLATFRMASQ